MYDHRTRPGSVREMFGDISGRYDLMNRLITFGLDKRWRRGLVRSAGLSPGQRLLDVGTGTGKIALEALRCHPGIQAIGLDFTLGMMERGRERSPGRPMLWCNADALALPFPDESFDAVTSAYLIRNTGDPQRAFREQMRVLRPGGRVVCMETSPPPRTPIRPVIRFHMKVVIPMLGALVAGNRAAYTYLPETTQAFVGPEQLTAFMERAGFRNLSWRRFMFGTQVLCTGVRPARP